MKRSIFCISLFILIVTGGGLAAAANPPDAVTIDISPSTTQIAIGDSLSIFCSVTVPEGYHSGEPVFQGDHFFVDISQQWHTTQKVPDLLGNSKVTREHYGFLTYVFAPDTLRVGSFSVDYTAPDGSSGTVQSSILTFVVKGVLTNPGAPPKPNRGPFSIPSKGFPLSPISRRMIILLILIAAVIAGVIIYLTRRRKPEIQPVPAVPIDEIGEFERIRAMRLPESGKIKEFYFLTSTAIRGFIHRNMGFDALYSTTDEIITHFSGNSHDSSITQAFREIMEESDMVKFAQYIPPVDRSSTLIDRTLVPVRKVLDAITLEKARLAALQEAKSALTPHKSAAEKQERGR